MEIQPTIKDKHMQAITTLKKKKQQQHYKTQFTHVRCLGISMVIMLTVVFFPILDFVTIIFQHLKKA